MSALAHDAVHSSRRIWIITLVVLVAASAILLTAGWHSYRAVDTAARERLSAKARLLENQMAGLVRTVNATIDQVAADTLRTGQCDQQLVLRLARSNPEFRAISVMDHRGINQCTSVPELIGMDRAVEDYVKQALAAPESRGLTIEKPFRSQLSGVPILVMHKAAVGSTGQARFLVQVSIDLRVLDLLLESLTEDRQTLLLMHGSGLVLSRVPESEPYRLRDLANTHSAFDAHRQTGKQLSTHKRVVASDGVERFVAIAEVTSHPLPITPRGKLLVGVGESVADTYAAWYRTVGLAALGCLLLLISAIALLIGSKKWQHGLRTRLEHQDRQMEELLITNQQFLNEQNALDEHAIVSEANLRGEIIYANELFCQISGYTKKELLGKNHSILNSRKHPPEFFRTMWQTIVTGQPWHGLVCNRAKDGHLYWVKSSIVPVRNLNGYIEKYVSVRTDVTALVQTQEALQRAQKDLLTAKNEAEHQRKIAEVANLQKSQFLASMSHELRTPMNAVLGFSQLLKMEDLGAEIHDSVDHIHKSGQHLLRLINEVLDLSRIESGKLDLKPELLAVGPLLESAFQTIAPLAQRSDITLTLHPSEEQLFLKVDPHRLQQVLLNLISNAIKYNRPQGEVRVTTGRRGSQVRISVTDTGIGLSPESLKKLFTPYTRFGPQHIEGTGIGLTITKRLVDAMGGTIHVESTENVGSTFRLEFPQALPETSSLSAIQGSAMHSSDNDASQIQGTVLYIEDNVSNQIMVRRALKKFPNLTLLIADKPSIGLALAAKQPPALILLDINLPEINGFEVFERLRNDPKTRHIPVVGLSANAMPSDREKARTAGFSDYLTKPVDIFSLLRVIRLYLQPKAA